ncbi:MAG: branched-chain amino acid ABC transporter substrate-binding protein [Caldilineaceae bacterium]|nr:branched-chain amino acid ABC transporter substrate-binding protein [Caldilineaceae bacterium]
MRSRLLLTTLLLVSLLLAACGGSRAADQGEVYVYVAVPLSGFQANGGQTVLGGVRLAAAQINRSGGLRGYQVVVRPLDDQSDSEVAVAQVETIRAAINDGDTVIGVIGHLNSGQTLAAMELYQNMPFVVITPTASEQSLTTQGYTNFFRVNANDAVQAAVAAGFLVNDLSARRVAVIHNDTEYGQGLASSLVKELETRGASVAVNLQVTEGQSIYTKEIERLRQAQADAIYYAGYEIEAPYLRAALVESGINLPLLASDGAFLAATIDESAGTADGMYVSAFAPSPHNVADAQWFEAYQAVEYRNPDTYSVNGYVAMQALAAAVRDADSFDRDAVAEALRDNTVDTLLGDLRFKDDGDLVDPQIWIYQVQNEEFAQVK